MINRVNLIVHIEKNITNHTIVITKQKKIILIYTIILNLSKSFHTLLDPYIVKFETSIRTLGVDSMVFLRAVTGYPVTALYYVTYSIVDAVSITTIPL